MKLQNRNVLAVGAHPDDVEFMCSGTLFYLKERGYEVHIASLTSGDCGSEDMSRSEIARKRHDEAASACRLVDAEYHCLGFEDFGIFLNDDSCRRVTALLRDVDPWIVITHPPQDYMLDHEMTSRLVRNACFAAPVPNYDTSAHSKSRRSSAIPYLLYGEPIEGIDLFGKPTKPHFYVDVSDCFSFKEEMLSCHESQRAWLKAHHGIDEYLEIMRRWAEELGRRATQISGRSVQFAEAFRQHLGHAYPRGDVLGELLGEEIVIVAEKDLYSSDRP